MSVPRSDNKPFRHPFARIRHAAPALAAWLLVACGNSDNAPPAAPAAVHSQVPGELRVQPASLQMLQIEPVAERRDSQTIWAPARIAFRDDRVTAVGSPAAGRIVQVHANIGDIVTAGQPLATVASPEALRLRAEAGNAVVAQGLAASEAQRQRLMVEKGIGVEMERAAAEARLREATQELDRARGTVALLGNGGNDGGGADRIVLRAPRAGVVAERKATVGAAVDTSGEPLFLVGDPSATWVVAEVFESDLAGLREGAEAQVETSSLSRPMRGRVQRIGTALNQETRRAPVFVSIENPPDTVRPGMLAKVAMQVASPPGLVIPLSAVLIKDERRSIVYLQRSDTVFQARDVELGQPMRGFIPVLGGLAVGDRIVVRGALLLDGAASQLQ
ncbi:efflux RND transporter periplasmic adaptor subunit [Xylophilus sp. GOD-11R]|uniref:efflux RND transporter periplasmic adaptor subunit n=1 Tax=Xylophilus sp. GOD-11R TaxID=3089814 RepID=UPI00298C7076|nr:efflux RND transporter periplasmic adaptor subunit [Xylophilus sp. GOD-11R]WPB55530.1 efflux RND transporter periplasmic adaptor subunit [Xylophilus sp. GOD-11R]